MSDVKRYGHIGYLVTATPHLMSLYSDMKVYVSATDFDELTADFNTVVKQKMKFAKERDQLKAENESLRSDIQSWRLSIEAERNVHKLSLKCIQDELDRLTGPSFTVELAAMPKITKPIPPNKPSEPVVRRIVNEKVINAREVKP